MRRIALALPAVTAGLALTACGSGHPSPAQDAYNHGYDVGKNALQTGNADTAMTGDQNGAKATCEGIVQMFWNGQGGAHQIPPGFTQEQRYNWYAGCADAIQKLSKDDSHATAKPQPSTSITDS